MNDNLVTLYREEVQHPMMIEAFAWADKNVFDRFGDRNIMLAGGALRSFFTKTPVRDYDLYFPSMDGVLKAQNELSATYQWAKVDGATTDSTTWKRTMISLHGDFEHDTFNLIHRKYYETPAEVISLYDFTVAMCGLNKTQISYHPDYFIDLQTKVLRLNNIEDPFNTLWRVQKYNGYGYQIDQENMWRLVEMIHDLPSIPNVSVAIKEPTDDAVPLASVFKGS